MARRSAASSPRRCVAALRERARERAVAVPAQLLRVVHRRVGVLEQRLGIGAVLGVDGVAQARAHRARRGPRCGRGAAPRRGSSAPRGPGRRRSRGPPARSRTRRPRCAPAGRSGAACRARAARGSFRSSSPTRWPQRVVHVLEVVEVQEHHGHAVPGALRARERAREPVAQDEPVGQPREAVVGGHVLQALLGLDARGDVLGEREDRHEAARRSSRSAELCHSTQMTEPSLR